MSDANSKDTGYALMIEERIREKLTSVEKTNAQVAFGSNTFSPSQIKTYIYEKKNILCFHGIQSNILGSNQTGRYPGEQQVRDKIFQTKKIS